LIAADGEGLVIVERLISRSLPAALAFELQTLTTIFHDALRHGDTLLFRPLFMRRHGHLIDHPPFAAKVVAP
jgi:hypothetical protein